MTSIRLLPALAATATLVLTFKIGNLATGDVWRGVMDAHAEAQATPKPDITAAPAADAAKPAELAPTMVAAAATGDAASTAGEADVLLSLAKRRETLDARAREISVKEQTLAVAEARIGERITELKAIEARINAALGQRETAQAAQVDALVKMYESMKPQDAARIFEKMDRTILVAVASKMKPQKLGAVLALMDPGKAQDLTVLLANRLNLDQIAAASPAAPTPTPAPAPVPAAPPTAPILTPDVLPQVPAAPTPTPAPQAAAAPPSPVAATPTAAAPQAAPGKI